jgi:adenylate cyclase
MPNSKVTSADVVASTPAAETQSQPDAARRRITLQRAVLAASVFVTFGIWIAAWWAWLGASSPTTSAPVVAAAGKAPAVIATTGDKGPLTQSTPQIAPAGKSDVEKANQTPSAAEAPISNSIPGDTRAPLLPPLSIVVLPFANLSNDPDQQYFADAITDDLTRDLSRISESFVIARNSAFAYKRNPLGAQQVGRELGVRNVLEAGVRRAGDQVRIGAQLIDVENGTQLWEERFETDRANLAEGRNQITLRIARTFGLELAESPIVSFDQERMVDPDARDLIMRGWAWYYRPYSTATWQEARQNFERALDVDPRSVDARVGLATILGGKLAEGWTTSFQRDSARAEQLLGEALERDANRSAAHFAMAVLRQMQNRLPEAQAEYEAAIALDHNHARAYLHLGQTLMFLGQPEAGVPHIEKAIRLNPYDPNIRSAYWALGTCYLLLGQLDQSIDLLRKAQAANSRLWFPNLYLAGAFGLQGDLDEARLTLAESIKLKPAINSLARMRVQNPWLADSRHWALQEKTLNVGLRRAGFPDE